MSDPSARAWTVTRRSLGATFLAFAGLAAVRWWPAASSVDAVASLAAHSDAPALRVLGARMLAATQLTHAEIQTRLGLRLAASGYDAALAQDRSSGALVAVDGWMVPETEALAGAWLASA